MKAAFCTPALGHTLQPSPIPVCGRSSLKKTSMLFGVSLTVGQKRVLPLHQPRCTAVVADGALLGSSAPARIPLDAADAGSPKMALGWGVEQGIKAAVGSSHTATLPPPSKPPPCPRSRARLVCGRPQAPLLRQGQPHLHRRPPRHLRPHEARTSEIGSPSNCEDAFALVSRCGSCEPARTDKFSA